jgi:hypothetical protein
LKSSKVAKAAIDLAIQPPTAFLFGLAGFISQSAVEIVDTAHTPRFTRAGAVSRWNDALHASTAS